ncbi:MAG: SprT-like domain-containing protein [Acidobacteriota bacterium]
MANRPHRKTDIPQEHAEGLERHLKHFLGLWEVDAFAPKIEMRLSTRMTRTIGSANPARNRITLAAWLFNQPQEIIDEVLCHEAAHLVVHHLHGPGLRPHGREWQALMRWAGVAPRVRIPLPNPPPLPKIRRRRRRTTLGRAAAALIRW